MTGGSAAVEGLSVAVGGFRLRDLSFELAAGEILVILGPNGSGKSVTLETIAGFHRPERGRVLIGGRAVTALPPERRNVGFVVQNFGLFPHLTVAQNVALAARRPHRASAAALPAGDVGGLLSHFDVAHLAQRPPQALSPGEKQRVTLARALAAAPDLFLFDEPFSAIDAATHDQLRRDLLGFLRDLSIPAVFVTHDQSDALVLADKVVVLRDGVTMQAGAAADVFASPANAFVAGFLGIENVLPAELRETGPDGASVALGGHILRTAPLPGATGASRAVHVAIRADEVIVRPAAAGTGEAGDNRLAGRVTGLQSLGALATVQIDCGFRLQACLMSRDVRAMALAVGSAVAVAIAPRAIGVLAD